MGLFTGLLTLPLAPVRGVVWVADQIRTEAERQWTDPNAVRQQLQALDDACAQGLVTPEERDEQQDALVARLMAGTGAGGG
jgi:hypothetical protein